jgi:uncharacterized Zn finger protein (UPF0148 family)
MRPDLTINAMETRAIHCPNCSAPLSVPIGETETLCPFCSSRLRMIPEGEELEVVRTREEMKRRERVDVQRLILQKRLQEEEAARWRQTAARVAIAALPVVGDVAGRALFGAAMRRGGCLGCGCLPLLVVVAAAASATLAFLR